jgi:nucleoside-diphosphate-sugar epimerase
MSRVIGILETLAGRTLQLERTPAQRGDVTRTSADVSLARDDLDWSPAVPLRQGLAQQYAWVRARGRVREVVA